jgi:hypothetical protein
MPEEKKQGFHQSLGERGQLGNQLCAFIGGGIAHKDRITAITREAVSKLFAPDDPA